MKLSNIKQSVLVEIKQIKDINKYRGFYFQLDDAYIVANFCSCLEKCLEAKYSLGFDTKGDNVVSHLFNKLKKGKKLTKNEKLAFYEKVDLFAPDVQVFGNWYDFRQVLHKVPSLQFYTLSKKISKKEINIFYEYGNDFIDIKELGGL